MATIKANTGFDVVLDAGRTFFHQKREQLLEARTKRKVYRTTFAELSALSNRELSDLGIARSHIRRLALETVYA